MTTPQTGSRLPTGETLPEYDDPGEQLIDTAKLHDWLGRTYATWNDGDLFGGLAGRQVIADVIGALQAVGNATLVTNATYRAMRRDGTEIERLSAWMANHGMAETIIQTDGNPVDAAIAALATARTYMQGETNRLQRLLAEYRGRSTYPTTTDQEELDMLETPTAGGYVDPDNATTGIAEQEMFNGILDQLADPAGILANALLRVRQADAMLAPPTGERDLSVEEMEDRALYQVGSAFVLRGIAEAAMALQAAELHLHPRIPVDLDEARNIVQEAAQAYTPQPARLRFTVRLVGHDLGNAVWVPELQQFVSKFGWWEASTAADDREGVNAGADVVLQATGRIVSATPDHALCVTDGGHTLGLPRRVLVESPDE